MISLRRYAAVRAISAVVFAVLVLAGAIDLVAELRDRRRADEWADDHDEDPRGSFALG